MPSQVSYQDGKSFVISREELERLFSTFHPVGHFRRTDRLLDRIEAWMTPIKLREELLGDIREEVRHRREQGWTENNIRRLIWWQFVYAVFGWLWGGIETIMTLLRMFGVGKG